jgi:hypothetical protein
MAEIEQKKSFVIDRAKWRFGGQIFRDQFGRTKLYNSEHGVMCCLGFVAEQLGIDKAVLDGYVTPQRICDMEVGKNTEDEIEKLKGILIRNVGFVIPDYRDSELTKDAMEINDYEDSVVPMEQPMREKKLIDLFAVYGFTLEFTGEYTEQQKQVMAANHIPH